MLIFLISVPFLLWLGENKLKESSPGGVAALWDGCITIKNAYSHYSGGRWKGEVLGGEKRVS